MKQMDDIQINQDHESLQEDDDESIHESDFSVWAIQSEDSEESASWQHSWSHDYFFTAL